MVDSARRHLLLGSCANAFAGLWNSGLRFVHGQPYHAYQSDNNKKMQCCHSCLLKDSRNKWKIISGGYRDGSSTKREETRGNYGAKLHDTISI